MWSSRIIRPGSPAFSVPVSTRDAVCIFIFILLDSEVFKTSSLLLCAVCLSACLLWTLVWFSIEDGEG